MASVRLLGKYYTPKSLADVIAHWAIRRPTDTVLDPSFGGCVFLESARDRLTALGAVNASSQLFGADIDPEAHAHLDRVLGESVVPANFIRGDFFEARMNHAHTVILGNPPYVRHHLLPKRLKDLARSRIGQASPPESADYWAYFLARCLELVALNGRIAMVLPISFLDAAYAKDLRETITQSFKAVHVIILRERVFAGAQEASLVLACEGFGYGRADWQIGTANTVDDIGKLLEAPATNDAAFVHSERGWRSHLLGNELREIVYEVLALDRLVRLDALAKIRIGVVTGCNEFFVLTKSEADIYRIPDRYLRPIINKHVLIPGLTLHKRDLHRVIEADARALLLVAPSEFRNAALTSYIRAGHRKGIARRFKCGEREPWYRIVDTAVPDAFLTYSSGEGPRIALNRSGALCTNAVHRVWWKSKTGVDPRSVSLSMLSTLGGVSSEIFGKTYGGGLLKLEPGAGAALPVWAAGTSRELTTAFKTAERFLRKRLFSKAREVADEFVLADCMGVSESAIKRLREAQSTLYLLRTAGNESRLLRHVKK
jgi:adenine-specific DNA-methyltransferase